MAYSRSWLRSGLGRPMDFGLVSNRFAFAFPLLAGMVAGAWALLVGWSLGDAVRTGFGAGMGSFLAWAAAREFDPDRPATAALAAVGAPWFVLWGQPALAAGFVWMLATRAVVGSTGAAPYPPDVVFVGALAAWVAAADHGLVFALGGLACLAGSTAFDGRGRRVTLVMSAAAMAVSIVVALATGGALGPAVSSVDGWWMAVIAVVAAAALFVRTDSQTDRRAMPVSVMRLRWGVVVGAAYGVLAVAWHGASGVAVSAPILVALAATGVSVTVRWGRPGALRARASREA